MLVFYSSVFAFGLTVRLCVHRMAAALPAVLHTPEVKQLAVNILIRHQKHKSRRLAIGKGDAVEYVAQLVGVSGRVEAAF